MTWLVQEGPGATDLAVTIGEESLLELTVILMRNAVEAMDGVGEARLSYGLDEAGTHGLLSVRDGGPGFAPDDLEKIFQPGFTTKAKGSGFGLFLGRRIVEDHGGTLEIGNAETGGAIVQVRLPLSMTPGALD